MVLNQRAPLSASGQSYEYESLVNTSGQSWKDYQLSNILSGYNQRDCECRNIIIHSIDASYMYVCISFYVCSNNCAVSRVSCVGI